jgi:RNA polymerase sigma-70 factor (ECF subfamily)
MTSPDPNIKDLYDEYADAIYRFMYWHTGDPLLAEDLTSEVFFRAWKHRDKLADQEGKPQAQPRAWLYRVARNLLTDHYRRKHDEHLGDDFETASDYDLHAEAEKAETRNRLHSALARLPDEHRTIIVLRFFERLPAIEVAVIMNKSEGNIRILQHRALKALKKSLLP